MIGSHPRQTASMDTDEVHREEGKSCEPLFSHSGRFYEKRDFGGKPKSLGA